MVAVFSRLLLASLALTGLGHAFSPSKHTSHDHMPKNTNGTCKYGPGNFTVDELWELNQNFWTSFIEPNNHAQAQSINSTFFAEDILGRIDATRDFDGRELNTEYVYGLFDQLSLNPGTFALIGQPQNFTVTQFVAHDNIVSTTVLLDFYFAIVDKHYPIEIGVWFTYNSNKEISQYDATFLRYLDWQFADMFARGMQIFNISNEATFEGFVTGQLAKSICTTHATYCNGTNQQYASTAECNAFLTNGSIPLGTPYQLGMDTVACRSLHQAMLPYRPDVHCPHVGPTGGGYCTNDRDYTTYLNTNHFTNGPFVADGYPSWNGSSIGE